MPEPITKTLADLDPAALPLAGTELAFVMQGGEPRKTPVSSMGGASYAYSGTHAPDLSFSAAGSGVFITYDVEAGGAGVSRVGNGAGIPSIGDTVVLAGVIAFADIVDSETLDIPLPFEMATDGAHPVIEVTSLVTDATATCVITSPTNARVTFGVTGDDSGRLQLRITYQTANAVDP